MCNSQKLTLGIKLSLLHTLLLSPPPAPQLPLHSRFQSESGCALDAPGHNILLPKFTASSAKLSGFSLGLTLGTGPAD